MKDRKTKLTITILISLAIAIVSAIVFTWCFSRGIFINDWKDVTFPSLIVFIISFDIVCRTSDEIEALCKRQRVKDYLRRN